MGAMLASVKLMFRLVIAIIVKRDSIIPSRHRSEDMRCDRYINIPAREMTNASIILM